MMVPNIPFSVFLCFSFKRLNYLFNEVFKINKNILIILFSPRYCKFLLMKAGYSLLTILKYQVLLFFLDIISTRYIPGRRQGYMISSSI